MFPSDGSTSAAASFDELNPISRVDGSELAARLRLHVDRLLSEHLVPPGRPMRGGLSLRRLERQARVAALLARTLRDLAATEKFETRRVAEDEGEPCPRDPQELRSALAAALIRQKIGKKSLTA